MLFAKEVFGNLDQLGYAIGYNSSGVLHKYASGLQKPGAKLLERMADVGCNIQWLLTGEGEMFAENDAGWDLREKSLAANYEKSLTSKPVLSRKRLVPIMLEPTSAGLGNRVEGYVDKQVDLHSFLTGDKDDVFCIYAKGDSMIGADIFDGDMVVVDSSLPVQEGDIVVAYMEDKGEQTIKRLKYSNGFIMLVAENPKYQPIKVVLKDIRIMGAVTKVIHDIKSGKKVKDNLATIS